MESHLPPASLDEGDLWNNDAGGGEPDAPPPAHMATLSLITLLELRVLTAPRHLLSLLNLRGCHL